MPKYSEINWVKNIKRDTGTAWAYMEPELSQEFQLNFSEAQKEGANSLKVDEIILLFQKVDKIKDIKPVTYLTHLVTPLDDILFFNEKNKRFPYERRVGVIARAQPNTKVVTTPDILNFHKPNWGKVCPIELLNDNWSKNKIAQTIWALFKDHLNPLFEINKRLRDDVLKIVDMDLFSVIEAHEKEIIKRHLIRERNPILVRIAKENACLNNNGVLHCECCDFIFDEVYGSVGKDFIECHHKQPISKGGERLTRITDLAMVCSNCHRMLHRKNDHGKYYTVEELREIVLRFR